jgi:glycosyltransferase family protein
MKFFTKCVYVARTLFIAPFMKKPKVLSPEETIDKILNEKLSIGRFGDGEMDMMNNRKITFQEVDPRLDQKLREITNTKNFLVCVPGVFDKKTFNKKILKDKEYAFWKKDVLLKGYEYRKMFGKLQYCGDTEITRFYIRYKNPTNTKEYVQKLKQIWDNRNLIIVEGEASKLGVGNDLFDNSATIRRILCPKVNAFRKYDEILCAIKENYHENDLVLLALGPTATCLAYDLSKGGIQALDVGHVDIEYEWFLCGAKEKISVKNKHVNEVGDLGENLADSKDVSYQKQIIEVIKNVG